MKRPIAALAAIIVFGNGCTYSVAGDRPAPIAVTPSPLQPSVEYTVVAFTYALGGGDMATAIFDGRLLTNEIMESWKERGYVSDEHYVAHSDFSGTADYHLTLQGSQRGETSFTMQLINALTLSLVPYSITQQYDFHWLLQDARSGKTYSATVQATDKTWVQPLLLFALPFAGRGHLTTMQRVGDNLYDQFQRQGAFVQSPSESHGTLPNAPPPGGDGAPPSSGAE